jgi:hypothetical protein
MAMSVISRTSRAAPGIAVALGVLTLAAGLANVPLDIATRQAGAGRLRQTVDLETVRGDLVGVVHEAFQPAHVSVWLTGGRNPEDPDPHG